jgi:hypothetical protein
MFRQMECLSLSKKYLTDRFGEAGSGLGVCAARSYAAIAGNGERKHDQRDHPSVLFSSDRSRK